MLRTWQIYSDIETENKSVEQKQSEELEEIDPSDTQSSENSHGGKEATKDIEDTINAANDGNNENDETNSDDNNESESESSDNNESESNSNDSNESESSDSNEFKAENESEGEDSNNDEELNSDENSNSNEKAENESEGEDSNNDEELNSDENSDSNESESSDNNEFESEDSNNDEELNSDENSDSNEKENNNEELNLEEIDNNVEDNDGNNFNKNYYTPQLTRLRKHRLSNAIATIFSKIAEDTTGNDIEGDDFWDIEKLIMRRYTNKNINSCKKSLERSKIILALDFSGSCIKESQFFADIFMASEKLGDVEIVDASNGFEENNDILIKDNNELIRTGNVIKFKDLKSRTIVFFGDYDGGVSLIKLSKIAKVYWFSCEDRYRYLDEHSWCRGYSLNDFKGKYYHCFNENDLLKLIKKIR